MEYELKCSAEGYPMPKIAWLFKPCTARTECDRAETIYLHDLQQKRHRNKNTFSSVSVIREVARRSGQILCQACNAIRCVYDSVDFFVTDVPDGGFSVRGPTHDVLVGDAITLECSASRYNFTENSIEWYKDTLSGEKKLSDSLMTDHYKIVTKSSDFSFTRVLILKNVTLYDKGRYLCRVGKLPQSPSRTIQVSASQRRSDRYEHGYSNQQEDNDSEEIAFKLHVLPLKPPVLINTNLLPDLGKDTMPIVVNEPEDGFELYCRVDGTPRPVVEWYHNGGRLWPTTNNSRIQILDNDQIVRISYVSAKDEGLYECKVSNKVGLVQVMHMVQLKSTLDRDAFYAQISVPVIIAVVIAIFLVCVLIGKTII